jgi:hypothetical protein
MTQRSTKRCAFCGRSGAEVEITRGSFEEFTRGPGQWHD